MSQLPERVAEAEQRRAFRELLDASSLGPLPAGPVPLEGARHLTGMRAEQACWEEGRMTDPIRRAVRQALDDHRPAATYHNRGIETCTCGHEVPTAGPDYARIQHLENVIVAKLVEAGAA